MITMVGAIHPCHVETVILVSVSMQMSPLQSPRVRAIAEQQWVRTDELRQDRAIGIPVLEAIHPCLAVEVKA